MKGLIRFLLVIALLVVAAAGLSSPAFALKAITIDPDQARVEITTRSDLYESHSDSLQVETAPGADGTTDRVSVPAATAGTNPNWMVFALTNPTDTAIERWIAADRYSVVGSGVIWPDLDTRRIEAVTPTMGFAAERVKSERADVFRITIEPGQTITYVVELASERFPRMNLWKPLEYELKVRERQLFNGIMLGLTILAAIFLSAVFAANHKLIFPASALVALCVLANLCVDFGFFHKLFQLRAEDNAVYRAAAESALAASILIFAHTFLRLGTLPALVRMVIAVWMAAQLSLIAIAVIDPRLAATFARLSFVLLAVVGSAVILLLALRGQDRAMSLVPAWVMFCVWLFGAGVVLTGRVSGDIAVSSLVAGLVLVLLLIGFVVTQFAFRARDASLVMAPNEMQLRSIAIEGAGAAVWEWNARRDMISVSPMIEEILDLPPGHLSTKADEFVTNLHPADRERFRLMLWSIQERAGGKIRTDLRLRHADNNYRWFEIEAASVPLDDDRQVRCVGLIRDITDAKRSQERLLHDAVHDSLTGLPNRALLVDRIQSASMRARSDRTIRPTLFFIDIDRFKGVNSTFGLVVGDSLLLTVARRLQRHLSPQDTLARVGGDQFAILSLLDQDAQELASLAERIRRSLRSPIKMAGQDIVLTGSVGVSVFSGSQEGEQDLLKDAEVAMYRAKRGGADRIEIFKPEMRADRDERLAIEAELRKAIETNQVKVLYQPIYYLPTEELAGFETVVRWEHPKEGTINPTAIVPVDPDSDLIAKLGSHVLMRAARDAAVWNKELIRPEPLFVSVNVASRQLFRQVLVQEVRHIIGQKVVPRGGLKLEVSECLVMENPEQAGEILEHLRDAGADLVLDDFGAGYSSLAHVGRLPFEAIKLQRDLVEASGGRDGNSAGVVRSIVAMARELDKKVIAVGVEAEEDASFLRSAGCEFGQGYFYGDAVPDYDVLQMLRRVRTSERRMKPRTMFRPKARRKSADGEIAVSAKVANAGRRAQKARAARAANGAGNGHGQPFPSQADANGTRPLPVQPNGNGRGVGEPQTNPPAPPPVSGNGARGPRVGQRAVSTNGAGTNGASANANGANGNGSVPPKPPAGPGAPGSSAGGMPPPLPGSSPAWDVSQASGAQQSAGLGAGGRSPRQPGATGSQRSSRGLSVPVEPTPLQAKAGQKSEAGRSSSPSQSGNGADRSGAASFGSSKGSDAPPPIPGAPTPQRSRPEATSKAAPPPPPPAGSRAGQVPPVPPAVPGGNGSSPGGPPMTKTPPPPPIPPAAFAPPPAVNRIVSPPPPQPPPAARQQPPESPPPAGAQAPVPPPPASRPARPDGSATPPPTPGSPAIRPKNAPPPDFSKLPPAIAESLARLAGIDPPDRKD